MKLGWILSGRTNESDHNGNETSMLILTYGFDVTNNCIFNNVDTTLSVKPDLEDFWNIESIGVTDKPRTSSDEQARTHFKETLTFENGRYQVTWPWKEENPDLPLNRELSMGRLKSTVTRMRNRPELLKQYDNIFKIR